MRLADASGASGGDPHHTDSDLSRYFTVLDQGHLITTEDISHLDSKQVPLKVEHIHSSDPAQSWSEHVFVEVTSDPLLGPQFLNQPYVGSIPENAPPGSTVENLEDLLSVLRTFAPFSNVSLVSGDTDVFSVRNGSSPALFALKTLDHEKLSDYSVTIEADDGTGSLTHALIQIQVQNANEHAPKFESSNYITEFPPAAPSNPPAAFPPSSGLDKLLRVSASDADGDRVTYSLADTLDGLFHIDPFEGDIGMNLKALRRSLAEMEEVVFGMSYELEVRADDGRGLTGSTQVQVSCVLQIGVVFIPVGHAMRAHDRGDVRKAENGLKRALMSERSFHRNQGCWVIFGLRPMLPTIIGHFLSSVARARGRRTGGTSEST